VRTIRWHTAELRSPVQLQIDGESYPAHVAVLHVDPRAVTIIRA
jgi:hypothetical protein